MLDHDLYCPCEHPDLPHLVTRSNEYHRQLRERSRARSAGGEFVTKSEEAWAEIPEGQRKVLGYRPPRKKSARSKKR